eukprot:2731567-Pleurochrysis_carterae.AAC.1
MEGRTGKRDNQGGMKTKETGAWKGSNEDTRWVGVGKERQQAREEERGGENKRGREREEEGEEEGEGGGERGREGARL